MNSWNGRTGNFMGISLRKKGQKIKYMLNQEKATENGRKAMWHFYVAFPYHTQYQQRSGRRQPIFPVWGSGHCSGGRKADLIFK